MSFALYRMYTSHGALLYVGQTSDLPRRVQRHAAAQPWWKDIARIDVQHFDTRDEALAAERAAHEVDPEGARPLYSLSQADCGTRGAETRTSNQRTAHAAGERCNNARCHRCTLARWRDRWPYGDPVEFIRSMAAVGTPVERIAQILAADMRVERVSRPLIRRVIAGDFGWRSEVKT